MQAIAEEIRKSDRTCTIIEKARSPGHRYSSMLKGDAEVDACFVEVTVDGIDYQTMRSLAAEFREILKQYDFKTGEENV